MRRKILGQSPFKSKGLGTVPVLSTAVHFIKMCCIVTENLQHLLDILFNRFCIRRQDFIAALTLVNIS